ncbi:hypothetical protein CAEBREN_19996 [Caenorhabditis brenneri]|uniref:C-type lectin domain-containing protein n=1 Tax=Caenorhabditis brenneri TaxID=135651 RepID=G0NEI9_CAEBE|nr:hypothetical protein CAEBREN_19996 [Caenorhabditis brenneri]
MPDNSCPELFTDVDMKVPNTDVAWKKSGRRWTLMKCMDGWELFQRPGDIFVCMKFFQTEFGANRSTAQNTCTKNEAKLSGVANRKKSEWMEKQAEYLNTGAWDGAWLDGVRSCDASEPNCHNYIWSDGFTSGNDAFGGNLWSPNHTATVQSCLTALSILSGYQRLNAVSCEKYDRAVGVICGYQLK